ncbi:transcriptional regulator Myc-B-like isoform X2 [Takifugu rubripes]|uniref:transcriptional regulator Myc-B-like isoform X2 n=1 Tax=Takifugu rubripes TaxID=31033 RepID=UPI0011457F17|nr:transcriptional regulator Myc-B-like isoform X2 [Takifugu rubripes]
MAMNSNYDPLQLFFHSENELQDVLPSKEFWKKFELLPSPSPNLAYDQSITHSSQPFLKPIIFQDCMWSGFNVDAELEKADATWMESAEEKSKHSAPPKRRSHCSDGEDGDDDNDDG